MFKNIEIWWQTRVSRRKLESRIKIHKSNIAVYSKQQTKVKFMKPWNIDRIFELQEMIDENQMKLDRAKALHTEMF